jgi:hypothetical protein
MNNCLARFGVVKMNTPKIQSIKPLEEKRLLVGFMDGTQKIYDCAPLFHLDQFQAIQNEVFFKTVKVDPGGCGVSWNDEIDLSEYELWTNGKAVKTAG